MTESKIREYGVVKLHEARRCRFCRKQYLRGEPKFERGWFCREEHLEEV